MTQRIRTATALGALVVLSLTGCMKMDMEIELLPEDQVNGTITIGVSREFAELAGQSPESIADEMAADMEQTEGTSTVPFDDGTYIGSTTTFDAMSIEEWTAEGGAETLEVVRDGDDYVVSGALDLSQAGEMESMGMTVPLDIRIAVTFPGAVSEHNGTLEGNTVEWIPTPGEMLEISARGSAIAGSGIPWLIIGVALGALVLVGVVVLLLARRRTPAASPLADPAAPAPVFEPGITQPAFTPGTAQPGVPPVAEPVAESAFAPPVVESAFAPPVVEPVVEPDVEPGITEFEPHDFPQVPVAPVEPALPVDPIEPAAPEDPKV